MKNKSYIDDLIKNEGAVIIDEFTLKIPKNKERQKAYREFLRTVKPLHNRLVKAAKDFKCWDYDYFQNIVFIMIQMMYQYYRRPDVLMQDTNDEHYKELISSLEKIIKLIDKATAEDDDLIRIEVFDLIKKNYLRWWD